MNIFAIGILGLVGTQDLEGNDESETKSRDYRNNERHFSVRAYAQFVQDDLFEKIWKKAKI